MRVSLTPPASSITAVAGTCFEHAGAPRSIAPSVLRAASVRADFTVVGADLVTLGGDVLGRSQSAFAHGLGELRDSPARWGIAPGQQFARHRDALLCEPEIALVQGDQGEVELARRFELQDLLLRAGEIGLQRTRPSLPLLGGLGRFGLGLGRFGFGLGDAEGLLQPSDTVRERDTSYGHEKRDEQALSPYRDRCLALWSGRHIGTWGLGDVLHGLSPVC
jgi:hypothetical protein